MVQQARRDEAPPKTGQFNQYEPEYKKILQETKQRAGDSGMTALGEWMVNEVHRRGQLPKPEAVRQFGINFASLQHTTFMMRRASVDCNGGKERPIQAN